MQLRPSFVQEQGLRMNPQLFQSIKLMELPAADLRETIEEEIERNPALELREDRTVLSLDAAIKAPKYDDDDRLGLGSDTPGSRRNGEEAAERQHQFIEGALSRPETLQEHLLWQLRLQPVGEDIRRVGELLIQNLDADGFHKEPPELLLPNEAPELVEKAITLVRSLDPQGTCTAGYRESLRVQARLLSYMPEGIEEALDCLELLERGKFDEAAGRIGQSREDVEYIFDRIKELSPFPGRQFASTETRFVVPDVQVIRKKENFAIIINHEEIPVLGINPFFMKLSDKNNERQARDFARENIREARWFIQSINQRNHTLLRVTRAIVTFQRSFFVNGPKYLAPLTLKDIAGELGVHEATVSRTANGKYVQTEWGIFEIRHFFSNSISGTGSGGSRYSKEGVKEIIRELISGEDRRFSDQEIVGLLAKRGIPLARRTVAKYRGELELGSSYTR
ncbi:RNA polymerase sigma-54 factor [Spirochaetia bacterium]|nr:RNA polymerase sigma-54 factor [Spirochaetia bacterium]